MTTRDIVSTRSDHAPRSSPGREAGHEIGRLLGRDFGALAMVTVLAAGLVAAAVGTVVIAVDRILPALVGLFG